MAPQPSAAPPGAARLLWSAEPPRRPARPAPAEDDLLEAIGELRGMLDAQLAHLNNQLVRIGSLIVQPPTASAPPASPEGSRLAAYCLGPFRLVVDAEPIGPWRSSKALALFQYMIERRQQLVSRDALMEALWGNPDALAVNTSLKVAVHALRQALQQGVGAGGPLEIVTCGSGYRLEAEGLWVDVEEFERSFALGRSLEAAGHGVEALALFGAAAGLYQGDFLQSVDLDWVIYRRESLRDQFLYVVGRLGRAAVAAGEYQDGIARCQQVLAQDACHEETYRLLMLCHARLGQRGRVRSWFELCARTLRSELDCAPEAETERVYRLALAGRGMTRKEAVWLACRTKSCCHAPIVVPTGRDVWRIARALDAPPWTFVRYFPSPTPRGDAFALDQSERRYRLALAKGPSRRKQPPCIFLMRTRSGHHRCGLGDLRPAVCRAFPSDLFGGVLCARNDGGCTCRDWSVLDLDVAEETELVVRREEEAAEYRGLVAEWNRLLADERPDAKVDFLEFCRFVVEAYDALAAAQASA